MLFLGSAPIGAPITGHGDNVSASWSMFYGALIATLTVVVAAIYASRSAPADRHPSQPPTDDISIVELEGRDEDVAGHLDAPIDFIFFLPSFCFSSNLRLRVMSPP